MAHNKAFSKVLKVVLHTLKPVSAFLDFLLDILTLVSHVLKVPLNTLTPLSEVLKETLYTVRLVSEILKVPNKELCFEIIFITTMP